MVAVPNNAARRGGVPIAVLVIAAVIAAALAVVMVEVDLALTRLVLVGGGVDAWV